MYIYIYIYRRLCIQHRGVGEVKTRLCCKRESLHNKIRESFGELFQIWFCIQGRRESTSSVAFKVIIMNCGIDFINLFIFSYLTWTTNLFIFNCFTSNFCFRKNIFRKQKRTAVYGRASVVSDFKLTRENNDLLSARYK